MKRTLTAVLLLALTVTAYSAPRAPRGQRGPRQDALRPQVLADFLDLTDAQKTQAQALRASMRAAVEPLRAQLQANREAVKAAVDAGNAQQAGQLVVSSKGVREQIKAAHETFETQFAALLNAEQKAKWNVLRELREARRDARHRDDD
ncbi:MAG TPA: Spy/CpxP family protein refolding chaperone [Thermoanaerobaculia bacterium]|nr:Spy/CpxP family protein refolding chaperone [Thermoanaerobaculia bacterium]